MPPQSSEETCNYYNSDFSTFTPEYKQFLADFFLAQIDSFEAGAGRGTTGKGNLGESSKSAKSLLVPRRLDDVDDEDGGALRT